jgi:hypothetical protein
MILFSFGRRQLGVVSAYAPCGMPLYIMQLALSSTQGRTLRVEKTSQLPQQLGCGTESAGFLLTSVHVVFDGFGTSGCCACMHALHGMWNFGTTQALPWQIVINCVACLEMRVLRPFGNAGVTFATLTTIQYQPSTDHDSCFTSTYTADKEQLQRKSCPLELLVTTHRC